MPLLSLEQLYFLFFLIFWRWHDDHGSACSDIGALKREGGSEREGSRDAGWMEGGIGERERRKRRSTNESRGKIKKGGTPGMRERWRVRQRKE